MRRPVLAMLLVAMTACTTTPDAAGPTTATPNSAVTDTVTADDVACRWGTGEDGDAPELLETGEVVLVGQDPVSLEAAMRWDDPPYDHASWHFALHALRWTYPLVTAGGAGDPEAARLADEVYRSWLDANADPDDPTVDQAWFAHTVALRTQVATCAVHLLDLDSAREILAAGVAWLAEEEHFDGPWNHGVDQSISLLMAGCTLGDEDSVGLAVERLDEHRTVAIDGQGVTNEQATGYQRFVRDQYDSIVQVMEACGLDGSRFERAHAAMLPMLVHATRPGGTLAPVGDTSTRARGVQPDRHPDAGTGAAGPPETAVTYERGYAFGRDHWGPDATWFSLRFGEGRIIHGHRDHASLLYDVVGVPVLTEAGFSGYQPGDWRDWERSHAAHNVVTVTDGGRFLWDHETPVVHEEVGDSFVSLSVLGRPYTAIQEHRRSVLVSFDPHLVVVRDVVTAGAPVETQQLWHLPPEWDVPEVSDRETVAIGPDGLGLRVLQLADTFRTSVVEGEEDPIQGFVAAGADTRVPAPVLVHEAAGTKVTYLTVLVPTGGELPEVEVGRATGDLELRTAAGVLRVGIEDGNLVVRG